jgi:predicted DNA-binding protein (MmcQ/YjbR family)
MPRNTPSTKLRRICLALPEAVEKVFGGHTAPTYRVRDKIFVMQPDGDRPAFWCKAPPGAQRVLVGSDPQRFFAPPYVGPKGWIGMYLHEPIDWALVEDLVLDSYRMTAPKRLLALLPA